jgi:hypothetical protein
MLTFFTTAKPFRGHDAVIQRNALKSWKLLHPDVEVILFGDEEGAAEVCTEFGLRHELHVERHNGRTPYANFMFARAQQIARHDYLCYSNCDIILMSDFWKAFEKARSWRQRFLMVSRRWDTDVTAPLDFHREDWERRLRQIALSHGFHQIPGFVDFFLFSRGLYEEIPSLVVGYAFWDHWMVQRALSVGAPVVDVSPFVVPVHQNHGYGTTPERTKGSFTDATAIRNFELAGGSWKPLRHIGDSSYRLSFFGHIYKSPFRYKRQVRDALLYVVWNPVWFFFLDLTRPLRSVLGLRSKTTRRSQDR